MTTNLVYSFQCTIPAGTAEATPYTQQLVMPYIDITRLQIKVPPGPGGAMGFAIGSSGNPVVPYNAGAWIVADNQDFDFAFTDQFDSGAWEFFGWNTGVWPHTVYLVFTGTPPDTPTTATTATLISAADISGTAST